MNTDFLHKELYLWYERNARVLPWRETSDPYKIWLSEIILQQTRVAQGMDYYMRFVERFPDVESLAAADEAEVMRLWQGLGYYSRARNLHKAAQLVVKGERLRGKVVFPQTFEALRQLPGVGDYTAGAIASFAYDLPYPAIDGNVYRVLARLTDCEIEMDSTAGKKHFHRLAAELLDRDNARLYNSAIMEFGALYCVPQHPDCEACPLQAICEGYQHHTAELLPIRKKRMPLKDRYLNYTIYLCDGKTLIHQRTGNDIWKHLFEFVLEESDSLQEAKGVKHMDFTHVLSHQRLHARFFVKRVATLPEIEGYRAVAIEELDDYALSRLTLKALNSLEAEREADHSR